MNLELISPEADYTLQLGARLGRLLVAGDVICLSGDLGAGKTAFASGIGKGWGALETVNSPTFVFVHEHHRAGDSVRLFHVDCYRLSSPDDAESVGIEDILAGEDIAVIEWPERIEPLLPPERLSIQLDYQGDENTERRIAFRATGARYGELVEAFVATLVATSPADHLMGSKP